MNKTSPYDVGVIVGRFQVPELHDAHKDLIRTVCQEHDKVIVFLGLAPTMVTRRNPLDFESRKQMILEEFPKVNVLYIKDLPSDEAWSAKLDEMVDDVTGPNQSALLYGGRDSFVEHYTGRYESVILEPDAFVSGNEIRKNVSRRSVRSSSAFARELSGQLSIAFLRFLRPLILRSLTKMKPRSSWAEKTHEKEYRLIGGFASPDSESFEQDARREVQEETGLAITDPEYVGSFKIDDWRYRGEVDKIKTLLFKARVFSGSPRPDDDIAEVRWFDLDSLGLKQVVPSHREMVRQLITELGA